MSEKVKCLACGAPCFIHHCYSCGADDPCAAAPQKETARLARVNESLLASLAEIVAAFDKQVAQYRELGDSAIADIAEQVHGKRIERARAAIKLARGEKS